MGTVGTILVVLATVALSAFAAWVVARRETKQKIEIAKDIGKSEGQDSNRTDVVDNANQQIDTNEQVIADSKKAIEEAQKVLGGN